MILFALALIAGLHVDHPRVYHEPEAMVVEQVRCSEWERTDQGAWLTETGAIAVTESGTVTFPVGTEATQQYAEDLWLTLELICNPYYGEGIWDDA